MSNTNNPSETTSTVIPKTTSTYKKILKLELISDRGNNARGTRRIYHSKDELTMVLRVVVFEVTKDVPARCDSVFPFQYSVEKTFNRTVVASGYAETLEEACEKASKSRFNILWNAVDNLDATEEERETLEQAIEKKR
jgi:hypothetical protein